MSDQGLLLVGIITAHAVDSATIILHAVDNFCVTIFRTLCNNNEFNNDFLFQF